MKKALLQRGRQKPILVAITGGSGSGKTWLASQLQTALGKARVGRIGLDDFYRDRSGLSPARRARLNFDRPQAIDWSELERVLGGCFAGRAIKAPAYDFKTHCRRIKGRSFKARPVIIVDGLWLLRRPALRKLFDLKIYLECPANLRLRRRIERDQCERGRDTVSIRRQFQSTVEPMHAKYVAAQSRWADEIITAKEIPERLPLLVAKISDLLNHLNPKGVRPHLSRRQYRVQSK
jgi:uridine kinase